MRTADMFWDRVAPRYARSPIKNVPAYNRTMERTRAFLSKNDHVLELGCGTGSTALLLAAGVGRITASDISSKMVAIGRSKARDQRVDNVEFIQATVFDDALENGSFDAVLGFNYLHLLDKPVAAIGRARDLLKPGGLFISKTPCLAGRHKMLRVLIPAMRMVGYAPPYVGFLDAGALEAWVAGQNLQILETGDYPQDPPSRFIVARKI